MQASYSFNMTCYVETTVTVLLNIKSRLFIFVQELATRARGNPQN